MQAKARALGRFLTVVVKLSEAAKDPLLHPIRDAAPMIADRDPDPALVRRQPALHGVANMGEFHRVRDQIVDHLPDRKGIAQDHGRLRDLADIQSDAALMRVHAVFLDAFAQQGGQVDGQPLKCQRLYLKLLHQQDIINQTGQADPIAMGNVER